MGVPKRRVSKARKNQRRSLWRRISSPDLTSCPQCHELRLSHRVCPSCGFYKGKSIIVEKE
ncbi:MAG: 50S ribosomal protein L32 [Bacillota bacterium]